MVIADDNGEALAACAGPVWANLPQTSPAGEFCGLAAACQLASGCAKHLYADYMGVVKTMSGAGLHLHRRCGFYSGIIRDALLSKGAKLIKKTSHVRSHQADDGHIPAGTSEQEARAIIGNHAADELATETMDAHPAFEADRLAQSKMYYFMANMYATLLP